MKKKILNMVLAFCMAFMLLPTTAFAADSITLDGITYQYDTQTGTASVQDYQNLSGEVIIPETIEADGNEYTVTAVGVYAFSYCNDLTNITIPDSVTEIGESAFIGCTSLSDIEIPKSVASIGSFAFSFCENLTDITIPDGVSEIKPNTFSYCENLTDITIPDSVTIIEASAFTDCEKLSDLEIPNSVKRIGNNAFYYCNSLTEIVIPESVKSIGASAFGYCEKLTDVYVPESAESGNEAFDGHTPPKVWQYKVLESAEESGDGKTHVEIISVKSGNGDDISDPVTIQDSAMGDGYVIDKVSADNITLKHTLIRTEAKNPTCTEDGNIEYWTCEICGKHFSDENATKVIQLANIVLKAKGHNYKDDKCTVCGDVDSTFKPAITAGANAEWQKGSKDGLLFTSSAAYDDFIKVQIDGKDLDASNYTVKEGSTIVTLKADYLETLSVGKHTLAIVSDTGTATTEFTIKAASTAVEKTASPQTGDNSRPELWIALLGISAAGILGVNVFSRKGKNNR